MGKTYKVWIHVEECDEEADEYREIDLPFAAVREFDNEHDAMAFADCLQDEGEGLDVPPCEHHGE